MRTDARTLAITAACGVSLGACEDAALRQLPRPPVQVDVLAQRPASLVDILWVVDNSRTMVQEQEALAQNFQRFIEGLTQCRGTGVEDDLCDFATRTCLGSGAACNPPDYHIGVISTDARSERDSGRLRRVGLCTTAQGASPSGDRFRYCLETEDCVHNPARPESDPANTLCDDTQSVAFVTPRTPGAASAFARAVRVGTGGSGLETGLDAAAAALGRLTDRETGEARPIPAENEGFLRADASLFIIFVSDEEDRSFGEPAYFYRVFETVKSVGNEGLVSISAIVGDPDLDGPGSAPGGCEVPALRPGDPPVRNSPGTRYVALAMYSRGLSDEFRVCDGGRLSCPAGLTCSAPVEGLPGVCVPHGACAEDAACGRFACTSGPCVSCVQGACRAEPSRFLELLEQNGVFGSICAPDYGRVLAALGFEAAGLARRFSLSEVPDCSSDPVPCCSEGVPDDQCPSTAFMCVKVNGQPVPNDRASGFIFDLGGRAVFFDGALVPPPEAEVQIVYRRAATEDNVTCSTVLN